MKAEEKRSQAPRSSVFWDIDAANVMREALNMPLVQTGKRECLCCERKFVSDDLRNQKMCNNCRQKEMVA